MKRHNGTIVLAIFFLLILVVGCGGEQSVASKSAAAYREAAAKGIPVEGGHEHGGHAAESTTTTAIDHATDGGTTGDPHAGMDHGTAGAAPSGHQGHGTTQMSPSEHAAMGRAAGTTAHAGHAGAARTTSEQHAGHTRQPASPQMDHTQHAAGPSTTQAAADSHTQHGATPGMAAPVSVPRSTAEVASTEPVATLRGDVFDAPAPIAISEAAKATAGSAHEGHQRRGITPGQDRENPPTPMPGTRDRSTAGTRVDHSQHDSASGSQQPNRNTALYACLMHPEVTSDKPGTCPKCGMALVKKN